MATPSWERIVEVYDPDGELRTTTDRMEVPGGWIYRELTQEGVALVFVSSSGGGYRPFTP